MSFKMKKTIPLLLIALCGLSGALRADSNLLTNGSLTRRRRANRR